MNGNRLGVLIEYQEDFMETKELDAIQNELQKTEVSLISQPRHRITWASIDLFVPVIQIMLSPDLVRAITSGLLSNAIYDSIRWTISSLYQKFHNNKAYKIQSGEIKESFANIHFVVGKNVMILPIDVEKDRFEYAVDKFFELSEHASNEEVRFVRITDDQMGLKVQTEDEIIFEEYQKQQEQQSKE